jgi:hypothetical protein
MANAFNVVIQSITEIHTLPGIWDDKALNALLALGDADDLGDLAGQDLLEMTLMVLQDMGNQKAGELVLEAIFGNSMRPGVRQNLIDDLQQDEPWSDFAEVSQQRGLFVAVVLLHQAFPTRYGTPDAQVLRINVQTKSPAGLAAMDTAEPAWLLRLLAGGMDDSNIVHRIYGDDLSAGPFKSAAGLIWGHETVPGPASSEPTDPMTRTIDVTAASQLFNSLFVGQSFKASVI